MEDFKRQCTFTGCEEMMEAETAEKLEEIGDKHLKEKHKVDLKKEKDVVMLDAESKMQLGGIELAERLKNLGYTTEQEFHFLNTIG